MNTTRLERARFIGPLHIEVLGSDNAKDGRGIPRRWVAVEGELYSSIRHNKKKAIQDCVNNYMRCGERLS